LNIFTPLKYTNGILSISNAALFGYKKALLFFLICLECIISKSSSDVLIISNAQKKKEREKTGMENSEPSNFGTIDWKKNQLS
jgi:hypothetical protein